MAIEREALERELRRVRKGRGVAADDIVARVGPQLRALCGVDPADDRAAVRRKVREALSRLCDRLPADLRLVGYAMFALPAEPTDRFLTGRLGWAGARLDRDERTVRRYADEALRLLADEASPDDPPPPAGCVLLVFLPGTHRRSPS